MRQPARKYPTKYLRLFVKILTQLLFSHAIISRKFKFSFNQEYLLRQNNSRPVYTLQRVIVGVPLLAALLFCFGYVMSEPMRDPGKQSVGATSQNTPKAAQAVIKNQSATVPALSFSSPPTQPAVSATPSTTSSAATTSPQTSSPQLAAPSSTSLQSTSPAANDQSNNHDAQALLTSTIKNLTSNKIKFPLLQSPEN